MRALMFFVFFLGVMAMSDAAATAQEKKEKPDSGKKESYDEKVTIREWAGSFFGPPVKDVPMFRWEISGKPVMYVISSKAPKGSEITDKDGATWVVDTSKKGGTNFANTLCYVSKKPDEKKP